MKAFVTGATGFVGGHLVDALLAQAHKITCLIRSPEKAQRLHQLGVRMASGDLHNPGALRAGIRGADVVFHVAGAIAARSAEEYYYANREGTKNIIDACQANGGVPLIYLSSLAAAGPAPRGRPLSESSPPRPVTMYGRSKLAAEKLVQEGRVPWTIVRPPIVYGPRDREVLRLFRLVKRGFAPVFGNGTQELSAVFVSDLAEALVRVATTAGTQSKVYFAAHPDLFTSRAFLLGIGKAMGKRPTVIPIPGPIAKLVLAVSGTVARLARRATVVSLDKAPEYLAPAWTCRPTALQQDTGFVPRVGLAEGLRQTAHWYRTAGWV